MSDRSITPAAGGRSFGRAEQFHCRERFSRRWPEAIERKFRLLSGLSAIISQYFTRIPVPYQSSPRTSNSNTRRPSWKNSASILSLFAVRNWLRWTHKRDGGSSPPAAMTGSFTMGIKTPRNSSAEPRIPSSCLLLTCSKSLIQVQDP
jgi:hypothetical protein